MLSISKSIVSRLAFLTIAANFSRSSINWFDKRTMGLTDKPHRNVRLFALKDICCLSFTIGFYAEFVIYEFRRS